MTRKRIKIDPWGPGPVQDHGGYKPCACRDCFEIAIGYGAPLCNDCEEAGCTGEGECEAPGAYGMDMEEDKENEP